MTRPEFDPHRYVWDIASTQVVAVERGIARCPHQSWSANDDTTPFCHDCVEAGLTRLVAEGATDDEIIPAFAHRSIPDRRWVEDKVATLRVSTRMTTYARSKAEKIRQEKDLMRRSSGRVTVAGLARRVEVDRGTLRDWIDRGWFTLD